MSYKIIFDRDASKFLEKSDRHIAERIIEKIELLKEDPESHSKPPTGIDFVGFESW